MDFEGFYEISEDPRPTTEDTKGHEKPFQMLAPPCFGAKDKGGVKDGRGWLMGNSAVSQPCKTNDG